MIGECGEFDRRPAAPAGEAEARWREHLAGCSSCGEQAAIDALLREARPPAPPELNAGFEARLRLRLERRLTAGARPARRPGGLRPAALWVLGAYGTAAGLASLLLLSRLPWQLSAAPPGVAITLGVLALLSPLVLLDRIGIVRPPG